MKTPLPLVLSSRFLRLVFAFGISAAITRAAADDAVIAAVRAADDARVSATVAADRARLETVLSDELRYAHSSGKVDSKASLIQSLTTRAARYETYQYQERAFKPIAPGVVLMSGRVLMIASGGGQKSELDLNFLAVWREEHGQWRFVAWQSSKPTQPPPAKG